MNTELIEERTSLYAIGGVALVVVLAVPLIFMLVQSPPLKEILTPEERIPTFLQIIVPFFVSLCALWYEWRKIIEDTSVRKRGQYIAWGFFFWLMSIGRICRAIFLGIADGTFWLIDRAPNWLKALRKYLSETI